MQMDILPARDTNVAVTKLQSLIQISYTYNTDHTAHLLIYVIFKVDYNLDYSWKQKPNLVLNGVLTNSVRSAHNVYTSTTEFQRW